MRNLLLSSTLLLAACNAEQAPEAQPEVENVVAEESAANALEAEVNGAAAIDNVAAPANAMAEVAEAVIPAPIRGRWGLVPADCTSTRGDAKGLIDVSDTQIKFYESRATLTTVNEADPSRIDADFDFSGEGQTWALRMTLDAQDAGQTLIRRDYGKDAMPGPLRYRKCAA